MLPNLGGQQDLPGGGQRWLPSDGQVPTLRGRPDEVGPPSTGTSGMLLRRLGAARYGTVRIGRPRVLNRRSGRPAYACGSNSKHGSMMHRVLARCPLGRRTERRIGVLCQLTVAVPNAPHNAHPVAGLQRPYRRMDAACSERLRR
jgi:hypothetical protein